VIGIGEWPAAQHGNPHDLEIAGRDRIRDRSRGHTGARRQPLDDNRVPPCSPREADRRFRCGRAARVVAGAHAAPALQVRVPLTADGRKL
jgi:hypothetical protein